MFVNFFSCRYFNSKKIINFSTALLYIIQFSNYVILRYKVWLMKQRSRNHGCFDENAARNQRIVVKKKKKMDRPTFEREKRKRKKSVPRNSEWDTLNARWKSDPGLVIKVPPCALIPESGYPFLGGNAATIKLRGPRSSSFVHVRPRWLRTRTFISTTRRTRALALFLFIIVRSIESNARNCSPEQNKATAFPRIVSG